MRDTTSGRNVEGPAFIMSEHGARMFFQFCLDIAQVNATNGGGGADVDAFLSAYDERKAPKASRVPGSDPEPREGRRGRRDWASEREALRVIMQGNGIMRLLQIRQGMNQCGYWPTDPKQATQQIKRIMERYPDEIVDCRRGTYHWPTEDGVVLRIKEHEGDDEQ